MAKNVGTQKWHNLGVAEVVSSLGSGDQGLSGEEVKKRLVEFGPNELKEEKETSIWALVAEQFKSVLIIILLAAVFLSVVIGIINYKPGGGLPAAREQGGRAQVAAGAGVGGGHRGDHGR